uniref:Uncharacterized protein n=1 Tax=Aureoumbra lagunensis TaxID=44058 RepID=A0A7S3NG92_9STRA|mmetsp:Transcript_5445/g.7677  ORF Transcript_5445/g.7677 Transcript_5445/m.7677 type:complete len:220 (-) Transcript_5445:119-778(-)|eukprot:CAMPEP_0197308120 /NCGR_PEP_ID=MMETSP0891-20130614/6354_1 /TAXON_ID=44058 ORGANISM="Aureoumbra lagunensis, Strain CCMP1510" /NCGR_SAMPLE_ID=MMETSP0891 /ASSEMBLY_ACC=CAM_ASM_000534 /LENGTH=219 /DNA_ID=CAMNT_0042792227 /DNA_START=178 /DNA_END=837 /DNA_ORIENTATION=-
MCSPLGSGGVGGWAVEGRVFYSCSRRGSPVDDSIPARGASGKGTTSFPEVARATDDAARGGVEVSTIVLPGLCLVRLQDGEVLLAAVDALDVAAAHILSVDDVPAHEEARDAVSDFGGRPRVIAEHGQEHRHVRTSDGDLGGQGAARLVRELVFVRVKGVCGIPLRGETGPRASHAKGLGVRNGVRFRILAILAELEASQLLLDRVHFYSSWGEKAACG